MNALESELRISRPAKPPKPVPGGEYDVLEPAMGVSRRRRARQTPNTAPRTPTAAIPATMAPTITPMWEELTVFLEELLGADPDAELTPTLAGSTETALVGWVPNCPFPMVTNVALLGIPWMVTNNMAGPGWNRLG